MDDDKHYDLAHGGVLFRFVADKSFFHDALRTDYQAQPDAGWLWTYLMARRTFDPHHKILISANSIVERLQAEFRTYPSIRPQVVLVIRTLAECYPIPPDIPLDFAPLYVAKILNDSGTVAVIVSSVKQQKWLERMKDAGVEWKVEGFKSEMSDKRAIEHSWFVPLSTHACSHILEGLDPLYKLVTKMIGFPKRFAATRK